MIRVKDKPVTPPAVLTTDGAVETRKLCDAYERERAAYRDGAKTFEFQSAIYAHETVKETLRSAQHGKCAFCESPITHVQYGDVEHFRPKKGFLRGGRLMRPGYYWLAYDWDNLLLACQICNQRHKRNAFPLLRGSLRARSHLGSVTKEKPVFIHPAHEDPATDIGFRDHVPYARNGSVRGRRTIRGIGLKRRELMEVRERHLQIIRALRDLVRICQPGPERARAQALLQSAVQDDAPFAAMVRAFLRQRDALPGALTP